MIKSFKSKALQQLWRNQSTRLLPPAQVAKIAMILHLLNEMRRAPDDLRAFPHLRPHILKGKFKGRWSLSVTGNYRIIFLFTFGHVYDVDWVDYHLKQRVWNER
ncbi:type II toxin-antitoxin system RelE/ParE family toxin [Chitinophaga lutea]